MSGPVATEDVEPVAATDHADPPTVEVTESRSTTVGSLPVRRALPRRARRTVGPWCFVDHMGPTWVSENRGVDIGPHPHIGLQTVTWLVAGEVVHRDSLGSEQVIHPGQLNLMTAGVGVSHSEEHVARYRGDLHGAQMWVAQPGASRHDVPAFEHHPDLPRVNLGRGTATVIVGAFDGTESPARHDTEHVAVELDLPAGDAETSLRPDFEYALVVFSGVVSVDAQSVIPGQLAYLGTGRDECRFSSATGARALLIGGIPFGEEIVMWWNFVARTRDEITAAYRDWARGGDRFGRIRSTLPPIQVGPPPWVKQE